VTGEVLSHSERREVVLLSARPEMTVTWSRYAGGEQGPGLHVHREHSDAFYVLSGELTFQVAGEVRRLGPGEFVAVPAGVIHTFANAGDAEATWLNFHTPDGGFAAFMRGMRDGEQVAWDSYDAVNPSTS